MTFVPSAAGMAELTQRVDGPIAEHLSQVADRVRRAAMSDCPVGPPPEPGSPPHVPLRDTIERSRVYPSEFGLAVRVGSNARYAAAVHDGARPHTIRPVRAKVLRFRKGGQVVFAQSVQHPGNRANPWLVRAMNLVLGR